MMSAYVELSYRRVTAERHDMLTLMHTAAQGDSKSVKKLAEALKKQS